MSHGPPPPLRAVPDWDALAPSGLYAGAGKRLFEAFLLVATSPFALALALPIAVANALLHGPRRVFFFQQRVGLRGRPFVIIKFRTMRDLCAGDPAGQEGDVARVTPFGRFLRSTHLDELPQLVNVVRGDMSIIGPRPEVLAISEWASGTIPYFERRLALRPGITGWAQITEGYAPMTSAAYGRKLARDDEYRRSLSFRFDLRILVLTAVWMLRGQGWKWDEKKPAGGASSPSAREAA